MPPHEPHSEPRVNASTIDALCDLDAVEQARLVRTKAVSALELMQAHLARIERLNPSRNAIVTLVAEAALRDARAADAALARGEPVAALHGLPVGWKDTTDTAGIRTTHGSPILAEHVPTDDAIVVQRMKAAGAITVGKTNTPEFAAGSQTFNTVFGATRNPYDPSKTCGGSSGGGAVALACGMVSLANGSDLGASLRNPASFCNVVGFRPSIGRVPHATSATAWTHLSVEGPMGRSVRDVALQMQVMSGYDPRAPLSLRESGAVFAQPLERDFRGVRIAWAPRFGDLPYEARVQAAIQPAGAIFESLGSEVEAASPDLREADEVFKVLRAIGFEATLGPLLDAHRARMKDTVVWNIEEGRKLTGAQVARAERDRVVLHRRMQAFMATHEFLVLPTMQVAPFDIDQPWVDTIDGVKLPTYLDWMKSCYWITVTGHPAISVPCGFTPEGLPVGLQIVGRLHDDFGVLQLAHAFETATGFGKRRPPSLQPTP
jgi:amidase